MRRFAPLFVVAALFMVTGCEVVAEDCYISDTIVDCAECTDYCEDADGFLICTDLYSDPYNCGACGAECFDGVCYDGICEAAGYVCEDYGLTTCTDLAGYDYCADLLTDDYNCGVCGEECVLGCDGAGGCL